MYPATVGIFVGEAVGSAVGDAVGKPVGVSIGESVGEVDGESDGDDHGAEVDEGVEVRASITSTSTRQWRHCGHEAADEEVDSYDTEEDEYVDERDGG